MTSPFDLETQAVLILAAWTGKRVNHNGIVFVVTNATYDNGTWYIGYSVNRRLATRRSFITDINWFPLDECRLE